MVGSAGRLHRRRLRPLSGEQLLPSRPQKHPVTVQIRPMPEPQFTAAAVKARRGVPFLEKVFRFERVFDLDDLRTALACR